MRTVRALPGVYENSKSIAWRNMRTVRTSRGGGGYKGTVRTSPGVYENSKSITLEYMRTVRASSGGI